MRRPADAAVSSLTDHQPLLPHNGHVASRFAAAEFECLGVAQPRQCAHQRAPRRVL